MTLPSTRIPAFCGGHVSSEDLTLITEIVTDFGLPRSEIANTVCELLNWSRPSGKLKTVEGLKYLEKLESLGCFVLPAPKNRNAAKVRKAKRTEPGEQTVHIEAALRVISPISISLVQTQAERDLWKELIDRHHYLGYRVPFGGALRYLIKDKENRILGCFQWSSPAWTVKARDSWIGWSSAEREANLQRIVQNSRFLILPDIRVKFLAGHVLAKMIKRIADDWEAAFAVRPVLLETFVDQARFKGTCYQATNWRSLGTTAGRGRMDRENRADEPVKSVWVYPLIANWRRVLGVEK